MKVKIVSDGKAMNTKVINVETGEMLEHVIGIEWRMGMKQDEAEATITLMQVPIEVIAKANTYKRKKP